MDLLIGLDHAGYLPVVEKSQDHLLLLKSHFSSGRLLSGKVKHEGVSGCDHILTTQATDYGRGTKALPAQAVPAEKD